MTATIGPVDKEEQTLLAQILMTYPVNHSLIPRLALTFVGADTVVGILAPHQVDVCSTIPVLGGQGDTRTIMGLQQS